MTVLREVVTPFFNWLVIIWEMTISGTGQPLLRVTKANNLRVLFPDPLLKPQWLWICCCAMFVQDLVEGFAEQAVQESTEPLLCALRALS